MSDAFIEVKNVSKTYTIDCEQNDVLEDINLTVRKGEFICVLGYTGCGKSTLLRIIAGFEKPDKGEVLVNGKKHLKPTKNVIMIFQDYNQLFPWKTSCGNIMHAVLKTGVCNSRKEARNIACAILDEVGLTGFYNYYPHQLSGGMRQRVAVGRALALNPQTLLMDEPFAALDEVNRFKLQQLCRKIFLERGISIIFVTHSISEAVALADRIVVMGRCKGNILADIPNESMNSADPSAGSMLRERVLGILKENLKNYQ